jgi:hypothetical protein
MSVRLGDRKKRKPLCNGGDRINMSNTKVCPRPIGPLLRDKLENRINEGIANDSNSWCAFDKVY